MCRARFSLAAWRCHETLGWFPGFVTEAFAACRPCPCSRPFRSPNLSLQRNGADFDMLSASLIGRLLS